jgi:c-di-AMP phosphodiesterase-like protein
MNGKSQRPGEPGVRAYLLFLVVFAAASLLVGQYMLAAVEGGIIVILAVYAIVSGRTKRRELMEYIESITYDTETAKNNTLQNFPLPIAVFRLDDTSIVWANQQFFDACGVTGVRYESKLSSFVPEFNGKWLMEGKNQYPGLLEVGGKKYQVNGNLVRSGSDAQDAAFMGIAYWLDVTDYDDIRLEYEKTRPVVAVIVVDNYEEIIKNQPDRVVSDMRDAVEDKLGQWCEDKNGLLKRFSRDRYLFVFEEQYLERIIAEKFSVLEEMHKVVSPSGIHVTLSIGIGRDGASFAEDLQFADLSIEMALSRGGDQAVTKNRFNFDFYGGRGSEIETRTKVKSRVMANALSELIGDSSRVYVMGHRFADMDTVGAAAGVCCVARKRSVRAQVVIDMDTTPAKPLVERLMKEPEYRDVFITPQEAMLRADSRSLLVLVDTNRPEQAEDRALLEACNHVAVIDHHRRAATYVQNADMSFIEPYASSVCELMTEILQVVVDPADILRCEAEAMLAGIVLDTKNFTLRTGERTFDAAAFLRRTGADTSEVKKLLQNDMEHTVEKYKILQSAKLYRNIAVAVPETQQDRVVAAQAADELLNVSGVDASMVAYPSGDGVFISARSIGDVNVQMIMEKLGGGGNRNAAAAQIEGMSLQEAVKKLYSAVDEYLDS